MQKNEKKKGVKLETTADAHLMTSAQLRYFMINNYDYDGKYAHLSSRSGYAVTKAHKNRSKEGQV